MDARVRHHHDVAIQQVLLAHICQRNGKLRILVDLRKVHYLLKNDYCQHNHPDTTIADAAQHMAGEKYICKMDYSQAYHCLQMADEQSVQLLASNFGSRTFAYLRLAQGLNRFLSLFNSTVREGQQTFSIRRRHRYCCTQRRRVFIKHRSCLPTNAESRPQTVDVQVCVRTPAN